MTNIVENSGSPERKKIVSVKKELRYICLECGHKFNHWVGFKKCPKCGEEYIEDIN